MSDETPSEQFSGGNASDIFETPDVLWHSQTTPERVVDTQSGFLMVVKQQDDSKSLSVKRQIGTPPSSSVTLTPDESVKLSKILSGTTVTDDVPSEFSSVVSISDFKQTSPSPRSVLSKLKNTLTISTITVLLVGVLIGFVVEHFSFHKAQPVVSSDAVNLSNAESFAREFVSQLLDFNSASYKISQIRAMASMTPDLVESYWKDTNFPLSKRQLDALSQDNVVSIDTVKQNKIDNKTSLVDVFAKLTNKQSSKTNPVHIQLNIERNENNQMHVTALKDLSSSS